MSKTHLAILGALALATPAIAGGDGLGRGDGVLDLTAGYATPGSDLDYYDSGAALGVHYYYHVTPRLGLGAGLESSSFSWEQTYNFYGIPSSNTQDLDVLSAGPFVRVVMNPASRFRAYVASGITYNRRTWSGTYFSIHGDGPAFRYTEVKAGAVAAGGFEAELSRRVLLGAEARFGYLDLKTGDGRETQTTLALRLGYRF
ncbi:MAG: outer membrane beta-barrel protein [Acidobacteriota bacterium]